MPPMGMGPETNLLYILYLFADLFYLAFQVYNKPRYLGVLYLRAYGVGFSVHLLNQKVKLSPDRFACL